MAHQASNPHEDLVLHGLGLGDEGGRSTSSMPTQCQPAGGGHVRTGVRAVVTAAILAAVMLAAPGTASAVKRVPPGLSAANQYTETLPAPGGNVPSQDAGDDGRTPDEVLGDDNAERLEALGPEGRAAAELAAATAPQPAGQRAPGRGTGDGGLPGGSSGLGEVLRQVTGTSGSGGMGLLLPLAIVAALAGSLVFLAIRRRTGPRRG